MYIKDNLKMDIKMDMERSYFKMGINIKDNLQMESSKGLVTLNRIDISIMVSLKTDSIMVKESMYGYLDQYIKDNIKKVKNMAMGYIKRQMEVDIKVVGTRANVMERDIRLINLGIRHKYFIKMVKNNLLIILYIDLYLDSNI